MADYIDMDALHAYGGFTDPTEEDDALLELLISTASGAIDNHCRRKFSCTETTAITFTRDNGLLPESGERTLWLPEDLCSVPTITDTPVVTLIPYATPYNSIVRATDEGYWPDPCVITGYWAYSLTPPVVIKQVCMRLTKWLYDMKESGDADRPIISNGIVIMPAKLPADVTTLLEPYRRTLLP